MVSGTMSFNYQPSQLSSIYSVEITKVVNTIEDDESVKEIFNRLYSTPDVDIVSYVRDNHKPFKRSYKRIEAKTPIIIGGVKLSITSKELKKIQKEQKKNHRGRKKTDSMKLGLKDSTDNKLSEITDENNMKDNPVNKERRNSSGDPEQKSNVSSELMIHQDTSSKSVGACETLKQCYKELTEESFCMNTEYEGSTSEISENKLEKPLKVCLLKNGGLNKLSGRHIETGNINLTNTCAFDSLIQSLATSFCDSKFLAELKEDTLNKIYRFAKELSSKNFLTHAYTKRLEILSSCFQEMSNSENTFDCQTTIYHMVKILNLKSYQEMGKCICGNDFNTTHATIICSNSLLVNGIEHLQFAINDAVVSATKCNKCGKPIQTKRIYANIVFIELNTLNEVTMRELPMPVTLETIPKSLMLIHGRHHQLRSCVSYEMAELDNNIGHFLAVCRRNNNQWEVYNDMRGKVSKISEKCTIDCYLLIYTL